jgi:hypothetical protein
MFDVAHRDLDEMVIEGLTRSGLEERLAELIRLSSHVYERQLAVFDAIDRLDDGGLDSAGVSRSKGKTSSRKANKAAKTAKKLATMPRTRKKLAEGSITDEHADAAADAADRTGDPDAADEKLSRSADLMPADMFAKKSREWADRNEPSDRAEQRHARQRRLRHARTWTADDDMFGFAGAADPIVGAKINAAWNEEVDRLWRLDGGRDGTPDQIRTTDQRRLDAFANLICGHTGTATDTPPAPATATSTAKTATHPKHQGLLLIDLARYLGDTNGTATITGGGPIPQPVLEQMLADTALAPLLVDGQGQPLWLGRSQRLPTPAQWRALIARDHGCRICGADPTRCEAHHIIYWSAGGPTDITNLILLCTKHHHDIHDRGHELHKTGDTWQLRERDGPPATEAA